MDKLEKIFIAREYILADDYGSIRIDEEAVFSSFDEARNFLRNLEDCEAEGNDFVLFRTEIAEYELGKDYYNNKWVYNIKGDLIESSSEYCNSNQIHNDKIAYNVGDIVYVLPRIKNKQSPSTKGTYGVIVEARSEANDESRNYVLYYITENGLLNHFHANESCLLPAGEELPDEFKFLKIYSQYLKEEISLPSYLISEVINKDIFVKNIKTFDFSKLRE